MAQWNLLSCVCLLLLPILPLNGEYVLASSIEEEEFREAARVKLELLQPRRVQSMSMQDRRSVPANHKDGKVSADSVFDVFDVLRKDGDFPPPYINCLQDAVQQLYLPDNLTDTDLPCSSANDICGSILEDIGQVKFYMRLALKPTVKTVCETGFYRGYSAALWLCAKPDMQLHSFDLEIPDQYHDTLKARFGARFNAYVGDSTQTVPHVMESTSTCCDVSVVDGGHMDDVPYTDIQSFRNGVGKAACKGKPSVVVMDEVMFRIGELEPQNLTEAELEEYNSFSTTEAWAKAVNGKQIASSACCGFSRGHFCTGYFTSSGPPTTDYRDACPLDTRLWEAFAEHET